MHTIAQLFMRDVKQIENSNRVVCYPLKVIQRRFDGRTDFQSKSWQNYAEGFGNPNREYWIGNFLVFIYFLFHENYVM